MMAPSNILFVTFSTVLWIQLGTCVVFVVTPSQGVQGQTQQVTFGCRAQLVGSHRAQPREIIMIQLTKGDDIPIALIRSNSQISYAHDQTRRLEGVGAIDNQVIRGYLNLTLHFPSHHTTGLYKCHVIYLDQDGVVTYNSDQAYLNIDRPSLSKAEKRVEALETLVHAMETKLEEMDANKDSGLFFSASVSSQSVFVRDQMTVVFDHVIAQKGQGYDPQTGEFTAPVDGIYSFSLALAIDGKDISAGFSMQTTKGHELARLYVEGIGQGDQSSVSSVVELKAGEGVKVVVVYKTADGARLYHNYYSVLNGVLVAPQ